MTLVSAAVFVYYPVSINANWVNPPVVFSSQGLSPQVDVTLYDDNTRAEVNVNARDQDRDLIRVERTAFIYDDFSSNPFEGRWVRNVPGVWTWVQEGNNRFISANVNGESESWGGEYVAYYAGAQAPSSGVFYVLVRERHIIRDWYQYVNLIMAADTGGNSFYALGYRGFEPGFLDLIGLWRYQNSWSTLAWEWLRLDNNAWFIFLGKRDVGSGGLSLTVYNSQGGSLGGLSAQDTNILARYLGVGVRDVDLFLPLNSLTADFDDFVACYANPSFVNVTGLGQGWRVELYDGNTLIDQEYADSQGFVSLNVLTRPIIKNGRIDIYDGNSNHIFRKNFSEDIVGGDVYMFVSILSGLRVLRFDIQDTKPYSFSLKLDDWDITGFVRSMDVWVESVSGTPSSSHIRIRSNYVEEDETNSITISNQGFIYLDAIVSYSSSVVLELTFKYSLQGVEVYYPVTVTVHG